MAKVKHTPGPWEAQLTEVYPGHKKYVYEIVTPDYDVVSALLNIRKEEDARLIAAAPELFEALEELLRRVQYDAECQTYWPDAQAKAQAALSKAMGTA